MSEYINSERKYQQTKKKNYNIIKTGTCLSVFPVQTHWQNTASYFPPTSSLKFSKKNK